MENRQPNNAQSITSLYNETLNSGKWKTELSVEISPDQANTRTKQIVTLFRCHNSNSIDRRKNQREKHLPQHSQQHLLPLRIYIDTNLDKNK